ncbi:MAG: helix-turn-helix domain-containing protein [Micromonosporaceae bacterium]
MLSAFGLRILGWGWQSMKHAEALHVPDDFWLRPETRSALRSRDVGSLFRLFKRYVGASQTKIGSAVRMEQGYVSKVMAGRRSVTAIDVLERIADGCRMPDECRMLLGLAPAKGPLQWQAPAPPPDSHGDTGMFRREMLRLSAASTGLLVDAPSSARRLVGARVPDLLRERAARLRHLDDILGGGDTYRGYLAECQATTTLLKDGR